MLLTHRLSVLGGILTALLPWLGSSVEAQSPTVIYQETFGFCTGSEGSNAAAQAGWRGLTPGLRFGLPGFMKVFPYGNLGLPELVNSSPVGLSQGYTFWFRPVEGLLTATEELSFDVRALRDSQARVEYTQRLSGIDPASGADGSRLALLIDSTWYISQQRVTQTNGGVAWEDVSWKPFELAYGVTPHVPGFGPVIPTSFDTSLPTTGTVRGFGTFMTRVTGRARFDNYRIIGVVPADLTINTSSTTSTAARCPDGSPDRLGLPTPTPGPDAEVSDESTPTPAPTPLVTPIGGEPTVETVQFCDPSERVRGAYVRFTKAALWKLLAPKTNATPADLRDGAAIAALSNTNVRLGALSNMLLSDYDRATGKLVFPIGGNKVKTTKLSSRARAAMERYLSSARSSAVAQSPIFLAQEPGTTSIQGTRAACLAEYRRLVRARARQAKVASQVVFEKRLPRRWR